MARSWCYCQWNAGENPLAVVVCFPCSVCFSGLCDCMVSMLVSHIGYTLLADAPWNLKKHIVKIEKIFVFSKTT